MKQIIPIIMLLLLISQVSGLSPAIMGGVVAASASNNVPASGQSTGGCTPPIQFSIDQNCNLQYSNRWSVNEYTCGNFIVTGDCKGGYIKAVAQDPIVISPWPVAGILLIVMTFTIWLFIKVRRMNKDKEEGYKKYY